MIGQVESLGSRFERVAQNAVRQAANPNGLYVQTADLAVDMGFDPSSGPATIATGDLAGLEYAPGRQEYSSADHVRGLTATAFDADLDIAERADLLDRLVAVSSRMLFSTEDHQINVRPGMMSRHEARGLVKAELSARQPRNQIREPDGYGIDDVEAAYKVYYTKRALKETWHPYRAKAITVGVIGVAGAFLGLKRHAR